MTADDLTTYLKDPSLLNKSTLGDLKYMADNYPYAHTFVFLYLYNLALVEDIRYFAELQRLAPFLADRNKLYVMVEKRYGALSSAPQERSGSDAFASIDRFLEQMEEKNGTGTVALSTDFSPLSGDYFSQHGISSETEVSRSDGELSLSNRRLGSSVEQEQTFSTVVEEEADAPIFTETLARLYIEQRCFDKAMNIILSMKEKNPEKSSYFADQIRFLERLIEINK